MAGKFDVQRVTSMYASSVGARSVVRRLSRWDNAWIFYDNPAYQPKQPDCSRGKRSQLSRINCVYIVGLGLLTVLQILNVDKFMVSSHVE